MVSMRSGRPICDPPRLSVVPNGSLETVPMSVWLTMALSRPHKEDRWELPLSTPLSSKRPMVRCPWLCAVFCVENKRSSYYDKRYTRVRDGVQYQKRGSYSPFFGKFPQVNFMHVFIPHLLGVLFNHHHLFTKFGIGQSDLYPCQTCSMAADHLLQACPLQNTIRRRWRLRWRGSFSAAWWTCGAQQSSCGEPECPFECSTRRCLFF